MPIEIRELVIRATVDLGEAAGTATPPQDHERAETCLRDDVVQACVREVLRILEDKQER